MTKTEAMLENLRTSLSVLEVRMSNTRELISQVDLESSRLSDLLVSLDQRFVLIEERIAEIRKAFEESECRRWAVTLALIGSILTLMVNIALWFVRK